MSGRLGSSGFSGWIRPSKVNVIPRNASGPASLIISGTRIKDDAGFFWVTCQTFETDTTGGPWSLDVRPANDDDTTPVAGIGEATQLIDVLDQEYVVTNEATLTRLSPSGFDEAYRIALDATAAGRRSRW